MSSQFAIKLLICCSLTISISSWGEECPYPSPFGPDDRIGASQTQTPKKLLEAVRLIEQGHVYRLHHPIDKETVFLPFGRTHDVVQFRTPLFGQVFNEAEIRSSIGQIGSQFDALSHAGTEQFGYYNCISQEEVEPDEFGQIQVLGIDSVRPFFTRAVLFDCVNHFEGVKRKGERLPPSYVITVDDIKFVMKSQGVKKPRRGDVALIYTGWDASYGVDNDALYDNPGLGLEAVQWFADRGVAAVGGDIFFLAAAAGGVEVDRFPPGHPLADSLYPSHQILLVENGIHILENLKLHELAAASLVAREADEDSDDDVDEKDDDEGPNKRRHGSSRNEGGRHPYEYAFVFNPLQVVGISGSPGNAFAVD